MGAQEDYMMAIKNADILDVISARVEQFNLSYGMYPSVGFVAPHARVAIQATLAKYLRHVDPHVSETSVVFPIRIGPCYISLKRLPEGVILELRAGQVVEQL